MLIKRSENKKILYIREFIIIFFLLSMLSFVNSCAKDKTETEPSSINEDNISQLISEANESMVLSESVSEVVPTEQEIYHFLEQLICDYVDKNNIKYVTNATIVFEEDTINFNSICNSHQELTYFSSSLDKINQQQNPEENNNYINLWQESSYFKSGICYFNDKYLGLSLYQSQLDTFIAEFNNNYYYQLLSYSKNLKITDENTYEYDLTDDIMTSPLISKLCSCISYNEVSFSEGSFNIVIDGNGIKSSYGDIGLAFEVDDKLYEAKINITVDILEADTTSDFLNLQFTDYNTYKDFQISKSLYNLITSKTFEISSDARIYFGDNKYIDTTTYLAANNFFASPELYYEINSLSDSSIKYEEYIFNDNVYEKIITEKDILSDFTPISETNKSTIDVSKNAWGIKSLDFLCIENISVTDDDTYHIIEYTYLPQDAINFVNQYIDLYNSIFGDFSPIPEEHQYNYISSSGKIIIRKSDYVVVEQFCDITVENNNSNKTRLVVSSQVLSFDEDITIPKP